jgi:hypothetical protein
MVSSQSSGNLTGTAAPSPKAYVGPNIPSYYSLAQLLLTKNTPISGGTQSGVVGTGLGSTDSSFTIQRAASGTAILYGVNAEDFWSGIYVGASGKIERIKQAEISGYV